MADRAEYQLRAVDAGTCHQR